MISVTAVCDRHYYLHLVDDETEAKDQVVGSKADVQAQVVQPWSSCPNLDTLFNRKFTPL